MSRRGPGSGALLPAVLVAWGLVLVLAPPASNYAWGVNGLRSAFPLAAVAALVLAGGALALLELGPRFEAAAVGAIAVALAFPLRESVHLLGDTGLRHRTLEALAEPGATILSTGALARTLHSQPLDAFGMVTVPLWLTRAGLPAGTAVAIVAAIALLFLHAGLRRALGPAPHAPALAAAVWLTGLAGLYAGYADGWPLTLAVAAWWWWALDRPLASPPAALLPAALWLGLLLGHRLGWVMLAPMAWRALAPPRAGDAPAARGWLAAGALAAAAAGFAIASASGGAKLSQDLGELLGSVAGARGPRVIPAWDLANLLALLLPFALLAPLLAGRSARGEFARSPSAPLFATALLPLLPMLLVYPVAPHGLGAHRDWDLAALPALLAGLAGARLLAHAEPARVRRSLLAVLPLLALGTGGWLAANADPAAGERRALALVNAPGALRGEQASHARVFLGYRAAGRGDFAESARHFERSAEALPNPRHELFAAQAWLAAGDRAKAVAAYRRALAYEPLPPDVRRTAETVRAMLGGPPPRRP